MRGNRNRQAVGGLVSSASNACLGAKEKLREMAPRSSFGDEVLRAGVVGGGEGRI